MGSMVRQDESRSPSQWGPGHCRRDESASGPTTYRHFGVVTNQAAIDTMKKAGADWDKEAAKATSLIVQSLSDDIYMVIDSVSMNPKEIWTRLVARFERITATEADRVEKAQAR